MPKIRGISVKLPAGPLRDAVRKVLDRIGERYPEDLARLQRRVRQVLPLEPDVDASGVWLPDSEYEWAYVLKHEEYCHGELFLAKDLMPSEHVGVAAHEFGHACTTARVLARRGTEETRWAMELSANWYAYRWGFGRDVARIRDYFLSAEHCIAPDSIAYGRENEKTLTYHVSRRFVVHLIEVREESVIEYLNRMRNTDRE